VTDNRTKAFESTMGLLHCTKISLTLVTNGLKRDRAFYPVYFSRPSLSHTLYAA